MTHATLALVHLASPAPLLRLGLHPARLPPLRRVGHRPGPQRRGAHHHPVGPGHRAARRLEGPGDLRRVRRLARRLRHPQPDPPGRDGPRPDLARLPRLGRRRHQGPPQRPARLGHLHLPRVHRPLPQPGHHRPGPQLGRPRGLAPEPRPARLVPAHLRAALLPQVAVARRGPGPPGRTEPFRTKCELAVELLREQARIAGGPHLAVFDGGFALRSVVRPLVVARGRLAPDRVPDPAAARRPAVRPAADGAPPGASGGRCRSGAAAAAAPPGRPVDRAVARGARPSSTAGGGRSAGRRWSACGGCSGHEVPVKAVVAQVEGYKKRFTLVSSAVELTGLQMVELFARAVPPGGRVPGPEAAAGLGGVPGVDQEPDRADEPGAVGDDEPAAAGAVPAGGGGRGGLVVPAAVEQGEGPAERAGRGAAAAAASAGNPATSVGVAGRWRRNPRREWHERGADRGPSGGTRGLGPPSRAARGGQRASVATWRRPGGGVRPRGPDCVVIRGNYWLMLPTMKSAVTRSGLAVAVEVRRPPPRTGLEPVAK